mmetsp:Transcript_5884/g.12839  ORF Transcript_5884/g.12839 Transcript_5884/m.12839 type:complete len:272 (+) Transcript_5884:238-1053(+)
MLKLIAPTAKSILSSCAKRKYRLASTPSFSRNFASSMPIYDDTLQQHQQCAHSLLILGKPGGGKGTISGKILHDFPQFRHVSTGDELRQHVRNKTALGIEAKKYMDEGCLVPDQIMIQMVMGDAVEAVEKGQSLLLDGFPRTMEQAVALDKNLDVDLVINLCIPNETIIERISDRWIHSASGRVYNYSYKPPKVMGLDDETGEPLVQREDDKPESVLKRLQKYEMATAPLVKYYEEKGVIQTFAGTESDVIYPNVKRWLDHQLAGDEAATV